MKRTHLPLNALRVFDAAARHLSFTKAADELAVTPAAVGQQIRALEDLLGVVLFKRMTRNLELTPEAERALPALRAGFLHFEESVRQLQDWQGSKTVTVAAPRALAAKWLVERLAEYARSRPELSVVLVSDVEPVDFTQANLDLAIFYGADPASPEISSRLLAAETIVTVAAPGATPDSPPPLIRYRGMPLPSADDEPSAEEEEQLEPGPEHEVPDAAFAVDAAIAGLGRARVPSRIAAGDLAAGRLVALDPPERAEAGWWLAAPPPQWRQAKVKSLVAFLAGG